MRSSGILEVLPRVLNLDTIQHNLRAGESLEEVLKASARGLVPRIAIGLPS